MADVVVVDDAHTYTTRAATEDQWDCDDTHTDHNIRGIKEAVMYSDLTVGFELEEGRTYYLIYALYSTGCSFCHETGRIEFIGLYEDEKVASENLRRLEQHHKDDQALDRWSDTSAKEKRKIAKRHNPVSVELITEKGQEYLLHVPWHGYFENLEGVDIQPVTLV